MEGKIEGYHKIVSNDHCEALRNVVQTKYKGDENGTNNRFGSMKTHKDKVWITV